jgi:hypothetical protein
MATATQTNQFQKKVAALVKQSQSMEETEVKKVLAILQSTRKEIAATVASTPWELYHLKQLKDAVNRAADDFVRQYKDVLGPAQRDLWNQGVDMVDMPLRAVGIWQAIPAIDTTMLGVLQGYGESLAEVLGKDLAQKVTQEITMGLLGQKTPFDVMKSIGVNLKEKSIVTSIGSRAETITRTEGGRILEAASQARKEKAAEVVPGLQKMWLHGNTSKVPRITHVAANGQIRDVDQPFDVGGEQLMYPRDPAGSPENTINCS